MALIDIKADEENYCLFTKDLEAKYQILRTRPEFQDFYGAHVYHWLFSVDKLKLQRTMHYPSNYLLKTAKIVDIFGFSVL